MSDDKGDRSLINIEGMGLCSTTFIVFLVLKLTGTIDWSWWWVTAPLWGGFALVVGLVLLVLGICAICALVSK